MSGRCQTCQTKAGNRFDSELQQFCKVRHNIWGVKVYEAYVSLRILTIWTAHDCVQGSSQNVKEPGEKKC